MPERKYFRKIYKRVGNWARTFSILKFLIFAFFAFILIVALVFILFAKDLPRPEKFTEQQPVQSTKIYDRSGKVVLYEIYGEEKRTIVPLSYIPENLRQAVIATEDANFYRHFGIDFGGIIRSVLINLKIKEPVYGGSTIPQQLIRSTFFSPEKTIKRKIREIVLALELDRRYSKDQILEWYLNQIPFGQNAYGVEAASQVYFQKPVSKVSLAEAATLAALIHAPSYLSPYGDYQDKLLARKDYILDRMVKTGFLTKGVAEEAKKETLKFSDPQAIKAPHFVLYIIENYLKPKYGEDLSDLKESGIKIYTSLDWDFQQLAEEAVKNGVELNRGYNANNAALVAIDPKSGNILAMVGSADWFADPYPEKCVQGVNCLFDPKFNIAIGTKTSPGRQPGSAFKPFVYVTAFNKGFNDKYAVIDQPTCFGWWGGEEYCPQNYDGNFRGNVTLRESLAQSLNVPSVKVLNDLAGLEDSIKTSQEMGITTLTQPSSFYGLSLVLGGGEVKLLDMVSTYGVFATEGLKVPPVAILKIEDNQGNIIEENKKTSKRVLEKEPSRLINDILSDNNARAPIFGYNSPLYFPDYQVAVKTGTTQDYRDGWTIGYTPSIVVGVWAGNNNNEPMYKEPGVVSAAPIFHNFLEKVLLKYPKENFEKP